jgi:glycosyltransferase involved in cell wall biosynthesis
MTKKIKVLEIIGDATLAGAPRHLLSLLENFNYSKFNLFVISTSGPLAGEIKALKKPINLEVIPMHTKYDLGAIREIRATAKHINPDIVHVHGTRAGVLGRLAVIGLKVPVIYTEHLWTKQYKIPGRIPHNVQLFGLWILDMFTNLNIAVSDAVGDFLIENQISRPEKVVVIYNGVEAPKKKAKPFSRKDEVLLGSIGTLNEQKGMQYLIQAMPKVIKEFPKTKLEIIGEGYYKDRLSKLIRKLKLSSHIKLTGFLNDVYDELEKMDIYVQPSLSESFGLAILQAMSVGLPVVATKTGGIPEVVTSSKTGTLVPSKDPKALADAILDLIRNSDKAIEMGKIAKEDAKVKFSLEDMVKETETVYGEIAKASP